MRAVVTSMTEAQRPTRGRARLLATAKRMRGVVSARGVSAAGGLPLSVLRMCLDEASVGARWAMNPMGCSAGR